MTASYIQNLKKILKKEIYIIDKYICIYKIKNLKI